MKEQNSEIERVHEVADRIALGLGDEYTERIVRDTFRRGFGMAVDLALLGMQLEDELSVVVEGPENNTDNR